MAQTVPGVASIVVIKRNKTDGPRFPLTESTCAFGRYGGRGGARASTLATLSRS